MIDTVFEGRAEALSSLPNDGNIGTMNDLIREIQGTFANRRAAGVGRDQFTLPPKQTSTAQEGQGSLGGWQERPYG